MPLGFTNNADAALVGAIGENDDLVTVDDAGAFLSYFGDNDDLIQLATLSNPATPEVLEIVEIYSRTGNQIEIGRGREGTARSEWPSGSRLSARITAGTLAAFLQASPTDFLQAGPAPVPRSLALMARNLQPVVQRFDYRGTGAAAWANQGFENVWLSIPVELGTVPAWAPSTGYPEGSIVRPTAANGLQYSLSKHSYTLYGSGITSQGTEPAWSTSAMGATQDGLGESLGSWIGTDLAAGLELAAEACSLLVSEVGFICRSRDSGVSSAPVVTIESASDSVKLADALSLSAITADRTAQRIPVTTARVLSGLRAKLETPAVGGSVRGNFYIRGVMVQTAF
ncbi:MAG: hypothetical protein LBI66_07925 [Burkholderiaceae bacterium]|jgi:hypothetical protein|nr:hypothetical protein [Burkholderiaceae bacterium]